MATALSAAQMAQMSRLLDEALSLDLDSRRQWLENVSPKHRELATALRKSLLPATDARLSAIDLDELPKIDGGPDAWPGAASRLKPNEQVGPYRLVRRLGAGGMAEVWLAQRADGAFKREVALKLPMLSPLRPDLVQRFARECDILASLEHMNIARMYEAGVRPDGLPYLVMEYVRGEPLIDWCDERRLELRGRIKLFLQVLEAVQYAHDHRVIHRDLKPSNILVAQDGQVRLVDFGVARMLDEPDPCCRELTRQYGQALTPAYASLEQVRGEPCDATSDVYSLGVVLYELLTGSRPYRIRPGASARQLEREIATVSIERPSARLTLQAGLARATTQRKLARLLSGNLDAIVLKALSPVRQRRYPSAAALANDLWRHLRGELAAARQNRPLCRTGRFLLRHRTGSAVAVLAAVGLALIRMLALSAADAAGTLCVSDKSIAVLPFVDMSQRKDLGQFAVDMSEQVRHVLSNVPELQVTARSVLSHAADGQSAIADLYRALGAAHVLEGSVRKSGSHLRVSARLVRADNGSQEWSETFDQNLGDLFEMQGQMASAVVRQLKTSLVDAAAVPTDAGRSSAAGLLNCSPAAGAMRPRVRRRRAKWTPSRRRTGAITESRSFRDHSSI